MNVLSVVCRKRDALPLFHFPTEDPPASRTREELLAGVARLSHGFRDLGVGPGSRVLILSIHPNTIETLETILAVVAVGATAAPVNPQLGRAAMGKVIDGLRPTCCVSQEPLPEELAARARVTCSNFVIMKSMRRGESDTLVLCETSDDDVALLLHTSGSTGQPKRIHRTHGQLASFVQFNHVLFSQYAARVGDALIPNPIITSQPLSHLSAFGFCLEALYADTPVYLLRHFDAGLVLRLVEKLRARLLLLIPSLYELLLYELEHQPNIDVSSLKYCMYGGEACPAEIARRIEKKLGVRPVAAYGLTECLVGCGHSREDLERGTIVPDSCGKQLFGETRLLDEQGRESQEYGELWVRNGTIPARSVNGEIDQRVSADGWFKTGDVMRKDAAGNFFHCGRVDDMFHCNGNNVYPLQIEQILVDHPCIDSACVAPIRNRRGHTIAAALVRRTGPVTVAELTDFARRTAPGYAVPAFIEFAEAFPVAPSGKTDRTAIRTKLQQAYESAQSLSAR